MLIFSLQQRQGLVMFVSTDISFGLKLIHFDGHFFRRTDCLIGLQNIYFFFKMSLAQIFFKIALLPLPGHEEHIGTLGYQIRAKLSEQLEFGHTDRRTQIGKL